MKTQKKKAGGALVIVLLIVVTVSIMSVGMMSIVRNVGVGAIYVEQAEQAFWLAESGLQSAVHLLRTNETFRNNPYTLSDVYDARGSNVVTVVQPDLLVNRWVITSRGYVAGEERVLTMSPLLTIFPGSTNDIPPGILGLGGIQNKLNNTGTIDGSVFSMGELWVNGRSSPNLLGDVFAMDGRNVDYQEITENDQIDISIDSSVIADFSVSGSPVAYTNILGKKYVLLSGGVSEVTSADLNANGEFEIENGIWGSGTLIVPDLNNSSSEGTDLKFSTAGDAYEVSDDVSIWVDGNIWAQKEGSFGSGVVVYSTGDMTVKKTASGTETAFYTLGDFTADQDLNLHGLIFAEGTVQVDGDLTLTGSLIAGDSFWLKGGYDITAMATPFFDGSLLTGITVSTYAIVSAGWNEASTM